MTTRLLLYASLSLLVRGAALAAAPSGLPLPVTTHEKRVVYEAMGKNHGADLDRLILRTTSLVSLFGARLNLYDRVDGRWVDTGSTVDHLIHMQAARGRPAQVPTPGISLALDPDPGIQVAGYRTLDRHQLRAAHRETQSFLELYPEAGLGRPGQEPVPVKQLASSMGEALRLPQLSLMGAGAQMLTRDPLIFHKTLLHAVTELWGLK